MSSTRKPWIEVAASGLAAGVRASARHLRARIRRGGPAGRWVCVTVLRSPGEVNASPALASVRDLGSAVETRVTDAPGGRGTEVAARWRPGHEAGRSPDELRGALRDAKQLLEVGEVLRAVPRPEGQRPATPGGLLVDLVERRSGGKGVL